MVLHNAADSLADLLQIKHERELLLRTTNNNNPPPSKITTTAGGGLSAARDSVADLSSRGGTRSSRRRPNGSHRVGGEYEHEPEEEDDAPVWEMDAVHPRYEGEDMMSNNSPEPINHLSSHDSNINNTTRQQQQLSIAECERVFAVPEVFEDVMGIEGRQLWQLFPCNILANCCDGADEDRKRGAVSDHRFHTNNLTTHQKMERMSLAVEMYNNIPAEDRRRFSPSLYKIRVITDGRASHPAMVGENHQLYGYGSVTTVSRRHRDGSIRADRRVHFSELKRVLKIRKFTEEEASDVWYQREDFAHFKAEMTLLIRDMEASKELAAMWLDSNDASSRRSSESKLDELEKPDSDEATRRSSESKLDQMDKSSSGADAANNNNHKTRAWWHNYDHSRRGLERYASHGQARQILASYKVATQKVFAEQRRQFLFRCFLPFIPRNAAHDADRIAELYHAYTAWSSDLALAAGASDEDCVNTNFDDETRKTREYYLLKQVVRNGYRVHKHMPQFMLPKCITPKGFLDERETLLGRTNDIDKSQRKAELSIRERIIETAMKSIRGGSQTGEEARAEMSRLVGTDLTGPIAPALAPMFATKDNSGEKTSAATSSPDRRGDNMAAKAKNYPFQQ